MEGAGNDFEAVVVVYFKIIFRHSPLGKGETDSLYTKQQRASPCSEWSINRYGNLLEGRRKTTGFVAPCKTVEFSLVLNRMQFAWTAWVQSPTTRDDGRWKTDRSSHKQKSVL